VAIISNKKLERKMLSKRKKNLLFMGSVIGFVNGLFGGGGGIIAISLLNNKLGLETKKAHATSLAIMLPISVISSITYLIKGAFPLFSGLNIVFGVVIGGVIGAILLKKLDENTIKKIYIAIMFFAGAKMLFL